MSLKFSLVGGQIKQFKSALQSLGKLGTSHELLLEAFPERLILRSINSSRSAYMSVTLPSSFFDGYGVYGAAVVQAGVLTKHALSVLRTQRVARLLLELAPETNAAEFTLLCENGLRKRYSVGLLDSEILQASVDRSAFPVVVVAEAVALGRLLGSFPPNLDEVTIVALPEGDDDEEGAGGAGRCVQLHSFVDRAKLKSETLTTQLALDTHEVFLRYSHDALEPADVTFNLRDLRALVGMCEGLRANVQLRLARPGAPLLAEPVHRGPGFPPLPFEAELVLATLLESQLPKLSSRRQQLQQQQPATAAAGTAARGTARARQPQQQRVGNGGGAAAAAAAIDAAPSPWTAAPGAGRGAPLATPGAAPWQGACADQPGTVPWGGARQQQPHEQQLQPSGGGGGTAWAGSGQPSGLVDDAGGSLQHHHHHQQHDQPQWRDGTGALPRGGSANGGVGGWPAAAAAGEQGMLVDDDDEEEIPPSPPDERRRSGSFALGVLPTERTAGGGSGGRSPVF